MWTGRWVERLPDAYAKGEDSNNYRILNLQQQLFETVLEDIDMLEKVLDLGLAFGKVLDLYGELLGQKRCGLMDEQYRMILRNCLVKNRADGDWESVTQGIEAMFGTKTGEVVLEERAQPGVVWLKKCPYTTLLRIGLETRRVVELMETLLAVGVRLEADNFEGTFTFCGQENTYDSRLGFGDREGTIGGYFGLALGEDEKKRMPV